MIYSLREYVPANDFEGMFSITREVVSLPPFETARRELSEYPGRDLVAKVAVTPEDTIVGFCAATYPYWDAIALIDYLVVAPDARGGGLGRRLVEAVESDLRSAGIRKAAVTTATWNKDAIRFYERQGYQQRGVFPEYNGPENDLVWLDRSLG